MIGKGCVTRKTPTKITDEHVAEMRRLYGKGLCVAEISRGMRISEGAIRRRLEDVGEYRRLRGDNATASIICKAVALYRQGYGAVEIGERFGYHNSTVLKWLRKAGEQQRSGGTAAPDGQRPCKRP